MATRLAPGVFWLNLGWPSPFGSNAFLIEDDELTLVDAGLPLNQHRIRDEIQSLGFAIGAIDRVLITHYDLDHIGGLARLVPDLDAPVYMGERDLAMMERRWHPPVVHHKGLFHRGLRRIYRVPQSLTYHSINDKEQIGGFTAFDAPGHNPGHFVYSHRETAAVLFGDLVWERNGELTTPIWFDSYDLAELRASIDRLATLLPAFDIACVCHGTPLATGGTEAFNRLVARLSED